MWRFGASASCYEGLEAGGPVEAPRFLNLGIKQSQWLVSRSVRFSPGERGPNTNYLGTWVDLKASLDGVAKIKISFSSRLWNPIASHFTDWAIKANQSNKRVSFLQIIVQMQHICLLYDKFLLLFIFDIFNDAVNSSDYTVLNTGRLINLKGRGRKQ
jgi:hypothetical protein